MIRLPNSSDSKTHAKHLSDLTQLGVFQNTEIDTAQSKQQDLVVPILRLSRYVAPFLAVLSLARGAAAPMSSQPEVNSQRAAAPDLDSGWQYLVGRKDAIEALESGLTALALLVVGGWALLHFGLRRERYPKAKSHHRFIVSPYDDKTFILRVELELENVGQSLVQVREVQNWIQQVHPVALVNGKPFVAAPTREKPEIPWPKIEERIYKFANGEREIEPKEADTLLFDYIVPKDLEVVTVYSYVANSKKRRRWPPWAQKQIGWLLTDTIRLSSLREPKSQ